MSFYVLGYFVALVTLGLWFGYRTDSSKRKVFLPALLLGLGAYALGILFSGQSIMAMAGMAGRDLLVLAGTGFLFQLLPAKKSWFWLVSAAILLGLWFAYRPAMLHSYQATTQYASPIPLDEEAELLVELKEGSEGVVVLSYLDRQGFSYGEAFDPESGDITLLDNYLFVNIPEERLSDLPAIKKALLESGDVEWLEENELLSLDLPEWETENRINRKNFGINDPGLEKLWGFEAMQVDQLYQCIRKQKIKPRKKALVAILDTGVDAEHEDIKKNYKSLKSKYDNDPRGHGTHCAGIAGAVSNNGVGVASFAPNNGFVQITSIKVLNGFGMGTQKSIINGIIEAADKKADVISLSLGGPSNDSKQRAYEKAVAYAKKKGAIVVVAAGNSNRNAKFFAPANAKGVITVSALGPDLKKAVFSNTVQDLDMGVAAPGVGIYSTVPGSKYDTYNGTSMATPYVAGLAGVMKAVKPDLTTEEFHRILQKTGRETDTPQETGRFIQPEAALATLVE
jgi:thermitase